MVRVSGLKYLLSLVTPAADRISGPKASLQQLMPSMIIDIRGRDSELRSLGF